MEKTERGKRNGEGGSGRDREKSDSGREMGKHQSIYGQTEISTLIPSWYACVAVFLLYLSPPRTRDPLLTSTTATLEASLPITPQKPRPLQSKGNNYFKVSERGTAPIETLFARSTAS